MQIEFHGLQIQLHASGAAYLPEHQVLLLADWHLGKINHFRKEGLALPATQHSTDFHKIENLLEIYPCTDVYILGDLFHSTANESVHHFLAFISQYPDRKWHLVKGNHDILPQHLYEQFGLKIHGHSTSIGGIMLCHQPQEEAVPHICGHVHPVVKVRGTARQKLRLPCFVREFHRLILPSFGYFTGGFEVKKSPMNMLYPIGGEKIFLL